jgi:heme-degrading monooxygenase HmoA
MYLRMVEAIVRIDGEELLGEIYSDKILTALENTPGCIFAALLHSREQSRKYISLTLWQSEVHAYNYEVSGEYQKNKEKVQDFLESGSEWKIQLSKDHTVEYLPVPAEPIIKSYPVEKSVESLPEEIPATSSCLRILSLKINTGYKEEFIRIYYSDILPELKKVEGCLFAFLLDNSENDGEMISLSIWDHTEAVDQYETSGPYKSFLEKVDHTLGGLYQWKMALENRSATKSAVTSQDIEVSKFTLITGKKFT